LYNLSLFAGYTHTGNSTVRAVLRIVNPNNISVSSVVRLVGLGELFTALNGTSVRPFSAVAGSGSTRVRAGNDVGEGTVDGGSVGGEGTDTYTQYLKKLRSAVGGGCVMSVASLTSPLAANISEYVAHKGGWNPPGDPTFISPVEEVGIYI
jgi:hypothetical protein